MTNATPGRDYHNRKRVLHMAMELGEKKWLLGFSTGPGRKPRRRTVEARDRKAALREIEAAKERFGLPPETEVYSCYEAGRDGFWIHRWLESEGVVNLVETAWTVEHELFGWRRFRNGRQVGAATGLAPTPWGSGETVHERGISRAGNRWTRALAVEVAWRWLRYQPSSELTLWFNRRFAGGGKRMRKVGIVALARKLMVQLWRFRETGVPPAGAVFKKTGR